MSQHDLRDLLVAIERTGEYHRPVQRAFHAAGCDTRLVHPYISKHFRLLAIPGINVVSAADLADELDHRTITPMPMLSLAEPA